MVLFALLRNDLKLFMKDWKAVILLLVLPFFFISLFVYALSPYLDKAGFIEPFDVAVVDKEETAQTRIITNQLEEIDLFKEIIRTDEEGARKLLEENRLAAAIILPTDFSKSILAGENKPVTVIGNRKMPLQAFVVKTYTQVGANLVSAGQSSINTIYSFNKKAGIDGKELQKQFEDSTARVFLEILARNNIFTEVDAIPMYDLTPGEYFSSGLIVIFMMFAGMPGMKMLVTERSQGITRRLHSTPVRTWHIIVSKFLVSVLLTAFQFAIVIVLTAMIFKNYWGAPVKNIILLFSGVIFAVSAWSIFVASISRTPAAADITGNLGILLMAVMGGNIYPLSSMPEFVRVMSDYTITKWAMEGFMILFSGNAALSIMNQVGALFLIGFVLLGISMAAMKLSRQ